jgi:hypothetical protein
MFRNKAAYPVYMTIGNIPKEIRRKPSHHAQTLLAYLPATRLEHITNQSSRRRSLANLFHACMLKILEPIQSAGIWGVEMASGDGVVRRCHPLFAAFVGDYPEQCLATCTKACPTCPAPRDKFGEDASFPVRDMAPVLEALATINNTSTNYTTTCKNVGIKPIPHPFWENPPYIHIFQLVTPDISISYIKVLSNTLYPGSLTCLVPQRSTLSVANCHPTTMFVYS